ncbi:MAG TPA: histidine--tRNA ligase [Vicinamibacteria bacterium]|nr:histidine--tRNA ligase [Vicinamibacteria bacterium]
MQPLKGFRDFYPEEMAHRSYLFDAWRRVARRFGFVEFDGPPLESLELYTRKSGEEIVEQLYTFEDKGGRNVALRPEMTPTLARMMAARAVTLPKPIKWFSIPQLFRYERNQRGRLREHFQLNVDIVGAPEVEADAELLAIAIEVQRELGLDKTDVVARVNDRRVVQGVLAHLEIAPQTFPTVCGAIDKFRKVPRETFEQLLSGAQVSPSAATELSRLCAGEVDVLDWSDAHLKPGPGLEAAMSLARYRQLLGEVQLSDFVQLDFSIVRGLAYYTGIVFELYDRKGKERAICGGGRYDELIHSLGGPKLEALGFGMGDVVLSLMLEDRGLLPASPPRIEVVVIPVGRELASAARKVTAMLRGAGLSAETPFTPAGVGKDLKAANRDGARFAVIIGPDEWSANSVNLKDLREATERRVPVASLVEAIRRA